MIKKEFNHVVFQIIKECDQSCPHCFFSSSPKKKEKLTLTQINDALADLKKSGINKINNFIITGGEPTLHPNIAKIVKTIKANYKFSKIRIDTNGLSFLENPLLFKLLNADIYDISIDIFHNQGILRKEKKYKEIFIKKNGTSNLVDYFIEHKNKYKFELNIRWTSNRRDNKLFEKFKKKYQDKGLTIVKKNVTATGRAVFLPSAIKGKGYTITEKPNNFKCLIGDSLLLAIDGFWYGCYHPVPITKLSLPGQSLKFRLRLEKLLNSDLGKKLPADGIINVLKSIEGKNPKLKIMVKNIINDRYWYRCQPCEAACANRVFVSN